MCSLAGNRIIVMKKADEGSAVIVWGCKDYVFEVEKRLCDGQVDRDVSFQEKIL